MTSSPRRHTPEISIVVPMFNSERFIETCVNSILNQTFQDFELILIDDCSNDNTLEIVRKFDDPRIKIYQQIKNSGESSSRNLGLRISQGKYVYFMDHDDGIRPKLLQTFFDAIEGSNFDVVYMNSFFRTTDEWFTLDESKFQGWVRVPNNPKPRIMSTDLNQRLQDECISVGVLVQPWIKIQRRDFLMNNHIYFPNITQLGDMLFNFAELCLLTNAQVIDAREYVYRTHESSTMHYSAEKTLHGTIRSMPIAFEYMHEIFQKTNLSVEMQTRLENRIMLEYYQVFMRRSYQGELPQEKINSILIENLQKIYSLDVTRIIFNTFAEVIK